MSYDWNTQNDYRVQGGVNSSSATNIGTNDAFNGRGMTPQQSNEDKNAYDARQAAYAAEQARQEAERRKNSY